MLLQKILHDKIVGLRLLTILFIAAGLALSGCAESSGGGGGFSDNRSDADLVDVMAAALAEALSLALLVLDAETGLALVAAEPGCEGLLIESGGVMRSTPGWQAASRFEPLSRTDEER